MKLEPVTRNKTTTKKLDDDAMLKNCDFIVSFSIYGKLEQSGSWIPDALSIKLIFSLIVTFYLTKTENRTKQSLTQLSHSCFE